MGSRRALSTLFYGGLLLAASIYGAWALLRPNLLTATAGLLQRADAGTIPESVAVDPPPFRAAAQGRVEPISGNLELAIGLVGTLAAVYVDEGDSITKGELLAELTNGDQRARVAEAEAQVRLRQAELDKLLHGARPEERRQAAAQVEKADATVALAEQELARQRPLAARGIASQQALDQATSSLSVAQAEDDAGKAALALINAPPRDEDVAIAKANLNAAEANLGLQGALLEKTQLRSPIDGVVLRRYLRAGETISVQPLIPILQAGDMRRLRVRAEIDETDVGRVAVGERAWVSAPAYPNRRFGGVITRIGRRMGRKTVQSDEPTEKTDTNVLDVLINLDDPAVRLPSGLRVNVFIAPSDVAKN